MDIKKIIFIYALFFTLGCQDVLFPPDKGELSFKLLLPNQNNQYYGLQKEIQILPSYIEATLNPGNKIYTFDYDKHSGKIDKLKVGRYDLYIKALDNSSCALYVGESLNFKIEAGKTHRETIYLQSTIPSGINATQDRTNSIFIDWDTTPGASDYIIHRSTDHSSGYTSIKTTYSTSYTDYDVEKAKFYYYKVQNATCSGNSLMSDFATGYRKGWRFDILNQINSYYYKGFMFDLHSYGYRNIARKAVLYVTHERSDGKKYYTPSSSGKGNFGYVIDIKTYSPGSGNEVNFPNQYWTLDRDWLRSDYQNNNYPQFIKMRIYQSNSINSIDDMNNTLVHDYTEYYPISWSKNEKNILEPVIVGNIPTELKEEIVIH